MPRIGLINWLGLWTLYKREVWRFMKVWNQTILAPIITALLFLGVMNLALGGGHREVEGMRFDQFIAPGLIMMAIVQNAFANTSSSLMLSKIQGVIVDILMPPLNADEITFSLAMGGVTRGVLVGVAVGGSMWFFAPVELAHPWAALYFIFMSSLMLSLFGVLAGVWSQSFDQMAAITNYLITPLSFLSGTFYSVRELPEFWLGVAHADPFFYMIDGFRYALTGHADGSVVLGAWVLLGMNLALWGGTRWLIVRGWRLKS